MQLFKRDNLVWGVFLIGLAGLPFLTMSTERVSWKAFKDAYSDCRDLTTLFASNNGFAGNTFDIENIGTHTVDLKEWWVNLDGAGATDTIDIYWRLGSSVGFESDPAGWTMLGSDASVLSNGPDTPTPVNMPSFLIYPGETIGFYVHSNQELMEYTNGVPASYADSDLSLTTQKGTRTPVFSDSPIDDRQWNGRIHYCLSMFSDRFERGDTSAWSN